MGATNSHEPLPHDSPPHPDGRCRILTFDPRSPSADIARTPIVVDKTAIDPRSPSTDMSRTPIVVDKTLFDFDPRSPSVGIVRTPINICPTSKTSTAAGEVIGRKLEMPDMDFIDSMPSLDEQQHDADVGLGSDDAEVSALVDNALDTLGMTGIDDLSLTDFPTCESTRLVPHDDLQTNDTTEKARLRTKKKQQKSSQAKELFPLKLTAGSTDVTRSPLSTRTRDMNSPLHLVQRKQMKDLDKKMTCAQENTMSKYIVRDKENV